MRVIILSNETNIEQRLHSFLPKVQFITTNNIISLHNEIIKQDIDAIFLDKNISSIWNLDISEHLQKFSHTWLCFYFNPTTLTKTHIELYNIEKAHKHDSFLLNSSDVEMLIREQQTLSSNDLTPLDDRLCTQQKELLRFFMNNGGKPISFKDMSEHLFGSFNEKHKKTLYTYIHTIRLFIEENPRMPKRLIRMKKGFYTYV